jgi:3-isopropylmalate/(R)-2-methylmalate dehydratase small subunit
VSGPLTVEGRARRVGDDVNTDYIISSRRKQESIDAKVLAAFLFESVDPAFAGSVREGDILVGGRNFGCGSAMEVAATVILAAGFRVVLAASFSRSFYRNAVNNGLLPVECDTSAIEEGDPLVIRETDDGLVVENRTRGRASMAAPLPPIMREIFDAGGLAAWVRRGR